MAHFGELAKRRIRDLGRSQKDLARLLGVSPAYVSQILTGKKNPPDLSRNRNRRQLRVWAEFLDVAEDRLVEIIRFELYRVPPRPEPKYARMRELLMKRLGLYQEQLGEEIRSLGLHPAESRAIELLQGIYAAGTGQRSAAADRRRRGSVNQSVRPPREQSAVERDLVEFFQEEGFEWRWNPERAEVTFSFESTELQRIQENLDGPHRRSSAQAGPRTVPVVGEVDASQGFACIQAGTTKGDCAQRVFLPPGIHSEVGNRLYCLRVTGDNFRGFLNHGALLFVLPDSWREVNDGDLVLYRDAETGQAFLKRVEFADRNLILKPMNVHHKNHVLPKSELVRLERIFSVVF